jgi:hypothetical protein
MRLSDQGIAIEGTQRPVALATDRERCVERNRAAQARLDRSVEQVGEHARAVAAIAAIERTVKTRVDPDRSLHGDDHPTVWDV